MQRCTAAVRIIPKSFGLLRTTAAARGTSTAAAAAARRTFPRGTATHNLNRPQKCPFHTTTAVSRTKNSPSSSSNSSIHENLQNTLGRTSSSAASEQQAAAALQKQQQLKERYHQSLINAAVSFMTVLLAAQALKSSSEKRAAQIERQRAVDELEETRAHLQDVLQNTRVARSMARRCCETIEQQQRQQQQQDGSSSRSSLNPGGGVLSRWFGISSANTGLESLPSLEDEFQDETTGATSTTASTLEEALTRMLQTELQHHIGPVGLTDAEKDKSVLTKYLKDQKNPANSNDEDEGLGALQAELLRVEEGGGDNETVVKKQVFRI